MTLPPSLELDLFHRAAAAGTDTGAAVVRFLFGSFPVTHPYYFFGQAAATATAEAGCRVLNLAPTVTVAQSDSDCSSVVYLSPSPSPPPAVSARKPVVFDLDLNCSPPMEAGA
jgi:EREBP-like factor